MKLPPANETSQGLVSRSASGDWDQFIHIRGARQNNLKNVDVKVPLNALTVVTGVSGSGKSTLAFDILYAEGQRRYVESFSAYARQFLDRMDKPDVESIEGIPPTIAIDQSRPVRTSRSTVGTMTELHDHFKLLFSKIGVLYCSGCDRPVERDSAQTVYSKLASIPEGSPIVVTFPLLQSSAAWADVRGGLGQAGFHRLMLNRSVQEIAELADRPSGTEPLQVIVDRFALRDFNKKRILDSLEQAFHYGKGRLNFFLPQEDWRCEPFSNHLHCPHCEIAYRDPVPNLFSFNSPLGACETCRGFGRVIDIDLDLVFPDPGKSLSDGAIKPWAHRKRRTRRLLDFCERKQIPTKKPWGELTEKHKTLVVEGDGEYKGIRGWFRRLERKSYRMHVRVLLARYRAYLMCPECLGTRLKSDALHYRIQGKDISQINAMSVGEAHAFFQALKPAGALDQVASLILDEIRRRLGYLVGVGLEYLTLDRQSRTLSGGELERVDLTTAIGSSLVNTLYVLDEPSIGLHSRDNLRLIAILRQLRDQGNTVLVVEHDADMIKVADHIVDLGLGAGEQGGRVVFSGSLDQLLHEPRSLTAKYLRGELAIPVPTTRRKGTGQKIQLLGASEHNLKDVDINIPLNTLTVVTGVSGSGKSTLVHDVLYAAIKRAKGGWDRRVGTFRKLDGMEYITDVVLVDQAPIGRTPRSNPVTYLKAFDPIRELFAATKDARSRGLTASHFSFNVPGGRCEACQGEGEVRVEMQFLADVFVPCDQCDGKRFKPQVLEVRYRGRSIHQVLDLTVREALTFFSSSPKVLRRLQVLDEIGLGYLRLGQPATTLSGGEAQRIKIAAHLSSHTGERLLYVLDEPTTGLHFDDIAKLLTAMRRLIEAGHSLLVIEHNLDVIKTADYIIDLGPEGGDSGGRVVATGTPEEVARVEASHTGRYLRAALAEGRSHAYASGR
jgi:excinuclease ABC subunit A